MKQLDKYFFSVPEGMVEGQKQVRPLVEPAALVVGDKTDEIRSYAEGGPVTAPDFQHSGPVTPEPGIVGTLGKMLHPWLAYFGLAEAPPGPALVGWDPEDPVRAPLPQLFEAPPAPPEGENETGTAAPTGVAELTPSTLDVAAPYAAQPLTFPAPDPADPGPAVYSPNPGGTDGSSANRIPRPATAVPRDYLSALAAAESGGREDAKATTSSATGLYQFVEGTWNDLARRYPELELTPEGRTDPEQQQKAIVRFTKDNAALLVRLGEEPTDAALRILHQFGRSGGPELLYAVETTPDLPATEVASPEVVKANRSLFYEEDTGRPYSVGELYYRLTRDLPGDTFAREYLAEEG